MHHQIERSNSLEEILIKVIATFRLQHDFLADLNDVLTLPGYIKLHCLCLEILLLTAMVKEYDHEESRWQLDDAAHALCSQLFNQPSLDFSCLAVMQGVDDDNIFDYFYDE